MAKKSNFPGVAASFKTNTESLLNEASKALAVQSERIKWLSISEVYPHPEENNIYDIDELDALARDISERGIQNALRVIPRDGGGYTIVGGHRRYEANKLAISKYGYVNGQTVPCVVGTPPKPGRDFEVVEQMILDNLQRVKSDYTRMMEIVTYKELTEKRRKLGEDIPVIRDRIKERLGASDSEITRYEKIQSSLIAPLMEHYKRKMITTTVAYEIAKMPDECQSFLASEWSGDEVLSISILNTLTARYLAQAAPQSAAEEMSGASAEEKENIDPMHAPENSHVADAQEEVKRKKEAEDPCPPAPEDIGDGWNLLATSYSKMTHNVDKEKLKSLSNKQQQKLWKKLQRQMAALIALEQELKSLGLLGGDKCGI